MPNVTYKKEANASKYVCGPGGINCPCCRRGPKRYVKAKTNRLDRHRVRQTLNWAQRVVANG